MLIRRFQVLPDLDRYKYQVVDLHDLSVQRMFRVDAMRVWSEDSGSPTKDYSHYAEWYRWSGKPLDYPLFSAGLYNGKYVVLLKEYMKCVVFREKQDEGIMLGDHCIVPGSSYKAELSKMLYIYKESGEYHMKFRVAYDLVATETKEVQVLVTDGCVTWIIGLESGEFRLLPVREALLC